jgi:hypothetical protein
VSCRVPRVTRPRLVALLAAACFVAGCGGDDDDGGGGGGDGAGGASGDEAAVLEGLKTYGEAVRKNDVEAACDAMTESAQEEASSTIPGSADCEAAHRTALGAVGSDGREKLADQLVGGNFEAEVSGETAEVTAPGQTGGTRALKMRRVDGEWKIDQNTVFFNRDK